MDKSYVHEPRKHHFRHWKCSAEAESIRTCGIDVALVQKRGVKSFTTANEDRVASQNEEDAVMETSNEHSARWLLSNHTEKHVRLKMGTHAQSEPPGVETRRKTSNHQLNVALGPHLSEKEVNDIGIIAKNLKLVVASGCFIGSLDVCLSIAFHLS